MFLFLLPFFFYHDFTRVFNLKQFSRFFYFLFSLLIIYPLNSSIFPNHMFFFNPFFYIFNNHFFTYHALSLYFSLLHHYLSLNNDLYVPSTYNDELHIFFFTHFNFLFNPALTPTSVFLYAFKYPRPSMTNKIPHKAGFLKWSHMIFLNYRH